MTPAIIDSFEGKYRFLSNFSKHPVTYDGVTYQNAEAAFQAQKCPERKDEFVDLTPGNAKRLGKRVQLRKDWEKVKDDIMYEVVKAKFSQSDVLQKKLLATGDAYLEEGNFWGDRYWGTVMGEGKNKLGEILIRVRGELNDQA